MSAYSELRAQAPPPGGEPDAGVVTSAQARAVVLGFGAALISGVAVAAFYRGADLVEVGAILLFLPVLVGIALGGVRGGAAAGLLASAAYAAVRMNTLGELPRGEFVGTAVVRTLLYLALGVVGGWAHGMLTHSLRKLELYDGIDDDTGVGNARALVASVGRERDRSDRYEGVFAVIVLALQRRALNAAGRRAAVQVLRSLCNRLEGSVRTTDLVHRVERPGAEEIVLVLPETGRTGALQLAERLDASAAAVLEAHGLSLVARGAVMAYPADAEDVTAYVDGVAADAHTQPLSNTGGRHP